VTSTGDPSGTFTAACIQWDVHRGDVAANLTQVQSALAAAATTGTALAVLPEMWSTSFQADYPQATLAAAAAAEQELGALSGRYGMVVVDSAVEQDGARLCNTARVWDHGKLLGSYRKIHLFSPNAEDRCLAAGEEALVVDTQVGRIGVMISYDVRFPELARHYFHRGAELLVVPAQWPEARSVHWRTLLRARAIENELFVVGCNRTGQEASLKGKDTMAFPGDSRIVDPMGDILAAGNGELGSVAAQIELRKVRSIRRILPVARDQRPEVYRRLWDAAWADMVKATRPPRRRSERQG
jgi:predicted amidohydrolase